MEKREAASEVAVTPSRTEGTQGSAIPLQDLNVGYGSTSDPPSSSEQQAAQAAGEEDSNDGCSQAPVTPQRAHEINPGTPFTPLANLKMLIAAASSALDREREEAALEESNQSAASDVGSMCEVGSEGDDTGGRKLKSLSVLCKKFLSIAEEEIGMGHDFSLETMAQSLGTNRRRIYDIINVLEALEMIVKQSKNWYTWLGRSSLLPTLAKLRAMALDDPEFGLLFDKDEGDKENQPLDSSSSSSTKPGPSGVKPVQQPAIGGGAKLGMARGEGEGVIVATEQDGGRGGRWDKSLGVLCQRFVMLFLIAPNQEVTLECAGSVLMPEGSEDPANPFAPLQPTNSKTKVRRLYDIANVLSTLGLIKKRTFMAPNHRKMPGYAWCGPSMSEIEAIPVYRKLGYSMGALYSRKKGTTLTRKPSFTSRPFLHQYEVRETHRSAPTTPVKTHSGGFRRNLSFGATTTTTKPPSCVLARPLCPKQLDYFQEVQEFEAEMQKHSHRYPHVASVFHEFIQKYQSTLEHATTGRAILPKPLSTTRSSPTALLASNDLTDRVLALPSNGSTLAPNPEVPICVTRLPSTGAMNVSSQNGNVSSVVPTSSASHGASSQPKPYRKILPAPTKDTIPILLNRACEIMNRKAPNFLASTPTYDPSSSLATCKPLNAVGTFPTESSTGIQPTLRQSLEPATITSEPSSIASTVLDVTCSTTTPCTQPTSTDTSPKQTKTSISQLTTPEFSQSTNSCPSDGSKGESNASASKRPPVAATPPTVSSSPPPLLLLLPQNVATTNNGVVPPNQPTLTYVPAKLNGSGGGGVSSTAKPATNMPSTSSTQILDNTNRFPGVQTVNSGTSQEHCTPSDTIHATEEKDKIGNTMANGVSLDTAAVSLACTQQAHKLPDTTQLATHGTLRSPNNEIHNRSFLNVENFLKPINKAKKSETPLGQGLPQKDGIPPPPPLRSSQIGTQALSQSSSDQPSPQGLPNMGTFVNQRPIPGTFEGNGSIPPQPNGNGAFSPTQRFDPNTFLAHPSQMFSSPFHPNVTSPGAPYLLAPNLSPLSSFCSGQHSIQVSCQQVSGTADSSVNDDTSPPKRPRLEENP